MAEVGIDLSQEFPKPLTDEAIQAADVVITVGCGDACPVYPGKRYLNWELTDPAGRSVDEIRPIRDDIDRRVRALLDELARCRDSDHDLTSTSVELLAFGTAGQDRRHGSTPEARESLMTAGELTMLVVTSEMTIAAVTLPGLGAAGTLRHVHSA